MNPDAPFTGAGPFDLPPPAVSRGDTPAPRALDALLPPFAPAWDAPRDAAADTTEAAAEVDLSWLDDLPLSDDDGTIDVAELAPAPAASQPVHAGDGPADVSVDDALPGWLDWSDESAAEPAESALVAEIPEAQPDQDSVPESAWIADAEPVAEFPAWAPAEPEPEPVEEPEPAFAAPMAGDEASGAADDPSPRGVSPAVREVADRLARLADALRSGGIEAVGAEADPLALLITGFALGYVQRDVRGG